LYGPKTGSKLGISGPKRSINHSIAVKLIKVFAVNIIGLYASSMQAVCRQYAYADSMQTVCRQYAGSMQAVCRQYADSMQAVCRQYSDSMQAVWYIS
jgi:hypothetical protein